MSEKIKPALTGEEWTEWLRLPDEIRTSVRSATDRASYSLQQDPAKLIALANHALSDKDPRRITHEWIERLRRAATCIGTSSVGTGPEDRSLAKAVHGMADALESYLPRSL